MYFCVQFGLQTIHSNYQMRRKRNSTKEPWTFSVWRLNSKETHFFVCFFHCWCHALYNFHLQQYLPIQHFMSADSVLSLWWRDVFILFYVDFGNFLLYKAIMHGEFAKNMVRNWKTCAKFRQLFHRHSLYGE